LECGAFRRFGIFALVYPLFSRRAALFPSPKSENTKAAGLREWHFRRGL
jgi:hypothetical protein